MRYEFIIHIVLMAILLDGCSKDKLSKAELERYVLDPDNGLLKEIIEGDVNVTVYYKPKDLILTQRLENITNAKERIMIKSSLDSLEYFVIRFSRNGKEIESSFVSDPARFNEVINYLGFYINNDLSLIIREDTIAPLDVQYIRTFGAGEATNVLTVFHSDLQHCSDDITLRFEDAQLGTGINEFIFDIDKIKNIPTLKIEQ